MNDPIRLLEGGSREERQLIAWGRADEPPSGAVARALSTLGVASAVALAPVAAHAAVAASGGAASGSVAGSAASASTLPVVSLLKWLGVGALGGTLTVAAATAPTFVSRSHSTPPLAPSASSVLTSLTLEKPRAQAVEPVAEPNLEAPSAPAGPGGASPARDSLAEELALLERARSALARGRANEAGAALGAHREKFPSGALSEEADVLRIEVALSRGEFELGGQAARDFLAAHPTSPHAPRVRALLNRTRHDPKPIEWPSSP